MASTGHGKHGEASADPSQIRYALPSPGETPGHRHERPVVERDQDDDGKHFEGGHGRGRYVHGANGGVHRHALLQERRRNLRRQGVEEHDGRPERQHPHENLELLHLCHDAQPPRAARSWGSCLLVRNRDNGGFVKESDQVRNNRCSSSQERY